MVRARTTNGVSPRVDLRAPTAAEDDVRDLVIRLTGTDAGIESLRRATDAQRRLRAMGSLGDWRHHVPEVVAAGDLSAWVFQTERALTGHPLTASSADIDVAHRDATAALRAIGALHAATAGPIDRAVAMQDWVETRLAVVARVATGTSASREGLAIMADVRRVRDEVTDAVGEVRSAGWIHGDLWAANVLTDAAGTIQGFVDWDSAAADELPEQDVLHLVLYARKLREHRPLGSVVADVLRDGWSPHDLGLLEHVVVTTGLARRPAVLLYWLRFVEANLRRQPHLERSPAWIDRNVTQVLACR
ncbi:MAG: phosphotransferase [Candidatus Limnocylindrales bacterium]